MGVFVGWCVVGGCGGFVGVLWVVCGVLCGWCEGWWVVYDYDVWVDWGGEELYDVWGCVWEGCGVLCIVVVDDVVRWVGGGVWWWEYWGVGDGVGDL